MNTKFTGNESGCQRKNSQISPPVCCIPTTDSLLDHGTGTVWPAPLTPKRLNTDHRSGMPSFSCKKTPSQQISKAIDYRRLNGGNFTDYYYHMVFNARKSFAKWRLITARQIRCEQLAKGFHAVARVRFEPSTVRLCDKNPTTTPWHPLKLVSLIIHVKAIKFFYKCYWGHEWLHW